MVEQQSLLERLQQKFSAEFHATEKGGREEMAEWLAAHSDLSAEEARGRIEALERAGQIHFVPFDDAAAAPSSSAMLEAARYGDALPNVASEQGIWHIGSS